MPLGPFLRRGLVVSMRRGTAFSDRRGAVVLTAVVVAGWTVGWDWWGKDRASVGGAASFAQAMYGWIVVAQAVFAMALVPALVAPAIASERDRKSLDSLLVTRLAAADIVLGTMGAGLLRYANGLAAAVPVMALLAILGGVEPGLVLLSAAGLASTVFAVASLAAAVSAGARTAAAALSGSAGLLLGWVVIPRLIVNLLGRFWPAAVPWVVPAAALVRDGGPLEMALTLAGVAPHGPLLVAVPRMIALQMCAGVVFIVWAMVVLRPASRAVHDVEGRAAVLRLLRVRRRVRPACGDDPVLWHEIHTLRPQSVESLLVERAYTAIGIGILAYLASWFAVPAFEELSRSGYGPSPGMTTFPERNPFVRVLTGKLLGLSAGAAPGQARLEFNVVLRQMSAILLGLYVLMVAGAAAESVAIERERDTWLGLIATPLSGWEILRAKMLGSIGKTRTIGLLLLALWIIGLLAGALHPLGFLAALFGMGSSCAFAAALGVSRSLWSRDHDQAYVRALGPLTLSLGLSVLPFMVPGTASVLLASGSMPFQTWVSLLSYEDVGAAIHFRASPQFAAIGIGSGADAFLVLAAWLTSTTAQAVGAFLLMRSAVRGFDRVVGRPVPGRGDSDRSLRWPWVAGHNRRS
jgi:hypothetical protein